MKNSFKFLLVAVAFLSLSFMNFESNQINIVIDAGHGGHDHGAKNDDISEKIIVAEITQKIQKLNKDANVKIHFTREDDSFMDLIKRAAFINDVQPDLAISLHLQSIKNPTAKGFEVYVSDQSTAYEKSNELAQQFEKSYAENTKLNSRGVKKAPFFVLKKSNYPTMLVELGFLSNQDDRNYLTSDAGQTEVAQTIVDFIATVK